MKCPKCNEEIKSSLTSKCPKCGLLFTPEVYQAMEVPEESRIDPNLSRVNPYDVPSIWLTLFTLVFPFLGILLSIDATKKSHFYARRIYNIVMGVGFIMYGLVILMIITLNN
ncbi:MAG: hypothetical protein ACOX3K_04970 [Bacilli bacterium]|jgi:hypothetical protein